MTTRPNGFIIDSVKSLISKTEQDSIDQPNVKTCDYLGLHASFRVEVITTDVKYRII